MLQTTTGIAQAHGSIIGHPSDLFDHKKPEKKFSVTPPEHDLDRSLNYYADFSGCGHWRMIWPEILLNGYQKCIVHGSTAMILDPRHYDHIKTVRVQRQASNAQVDFVKFLRSIKSSRNNFNLIYEIDDVLFHEDIPKYNKFRAAFVDPEIRNAALSIMNMCDEITVTCDYMKEYYKQKTNHPNITVIQNYMPRFWMDCFYDEKQLSINYDKSIKKRKRPRVLWAGSGAHFDVTNDTNFNDDFRHVIESVIKTRKKYQWVFLGAYPLLLKSYVTAGDIEYHPWASIYEYPRVKHSLKTNVMVAPLQDNPFNNSKSDLKYIEGSAFGQPVICQDISTYSNALHKFNTGDEMIDQIDNVLKDKTIYMKSCRKARASISDRWLEDNIQKYAELYSYPVRDPKRKLINKTNKY